MFVTPGSPWAGYTSQHSGLRKDVLESKNQAFFFSFHARPKLSF